MPHLTYTHDIPGLAAFVPLDYGRWEHAVLLIPDEWESLWDLIVAPQAFMTKCQQMFSSTPAEGGVPDGTAVSGNVKHALDWNFAGQDITVLIQPLTVQSQSTWEILNALAPLNGDIRERVLPIFHTAAPTKFREKVISACLAPSGATFPGEAAFLSLSNTMPFSGFEGPAYKEGKNLQIHYVAAFALETRMLCVWYVPHAHDSNQPYWSAKHRSNTASYKRRMGHGLTPVTVDKVGATRLTLIHFDVDFDRALKPKGTGVSEHSVAARRADLAMDYIENPLVLNDLFNDTNGLEPKKTTAVPTGFKKFAGHMKRTDKSLVLPASTGVDAQAPRIDFHKDANGKDLRMDPTVIIDCVKHSPQVWKVEKGPDSGDSGHLERADFTLEDGSTLLPCTMLHVTDATDANGHLIKMDPSSGTVYYYGSSGYNNGSLVPAYYEPGTMILKAYLGNMGGGQ